MRAVSTMLSVIFLLSTLPASAELSRGQLKLVQRYSKTLKKSRKADDRREAARELGNLEGPEVVEPLIGALSDKDADVRRQAADSLWRVDEFAAPAIDALKAVLDDPSPGVRVRAAAALEALDVPEEDLVDARVPALEAERLRDRILAARDLVGFVDGARLVPPILEVAHAEADTWKSDLGGRYLSPIPILERLVATGEQDFVEPVLEGIRAGNAGSRFLLEGLSDLEPKPEAWNQILTAQLQSTRTDDRTTALDLLENRTTEAEGVEQWIEPVIAVLADPECRLHALMALASAKAFAAPAAPELASLILEDPDPDMRERAASTLERIGNRGQAFPSDVLREVAVTALPALTKAAVEDTDSDVRKAATSTLGELRLSADEVLSTLLAVAQNDPVEFNRFKALLRIRDLGTDATSAIPVLEAIIEADPATRPTAEQALNFVKTSPPDFTLESTTSTGSAGSAQALSELRNAGVDFTLHGFYTALRTADLETIRLFLDAGMGPNDPVDDVGMRPLHVLYFGNNGCSTFVRPTAESTVEITKLLLERGADPNATDDRTNSVLKLAVMGCDAAIIRLLLAAGADMYATDMNGMAPFELTLWSGTDAADPLLEAGYTLPIEKVEAYLEAYKDNAKAIDLVRRATPAEAR